MAVNVRNLEPSSYSSFVKEFSHAREAIKNGVLGELKDAVEKLKKDNPRGGKVPTNNVLDVYEMVPDPFTNNCYPMTLLAYAGYHGNIKMLEFLTDEGAHADLEIPNCGTPLLQMIVYAHSKQDKHNLQRPTIDIGAVQFFIDKRVNLHCKVMEGSYQDTALGMVITFKCYEIAKLLVSNGADPLYGEKGDIIDALVEYTQHGTNVFLKWFFDEHTRPEAIPVLIRRLLDLNVFSNGRVHHIITTTFGKNAAHAFLLCGHKGVIDCLVGEKASLLTEVDRSGKTALHIAAEKGDDKSVEILLPHCSEEVKTTTDGRSMTPLMLATMNGHEKVVSLLATRTPAELMWALRYGYAAYFEAMHKTLEGEEELTKPLPNLKKNTIAHLAAEKGLVSVFKATFPNGRLWARDQTCFKILTEENDDHKTPLQIAISKGNIAILHSLEERMLDRKKVDGDYRQNQRESIEETDWGLFWKEHSRKLLLYACFHGTVEIVDYFISRHVETKITFDDLTPLSCAAWGGKHDIIDYLLKIEGVKEYAETVPDHWSPVMLASKSGHTKCVSLLLENEAERKVLSERRYNCLMEAVKAGHEETAVALLACPNKGWKDFMTYFGINQKVYPLMMLIKEMPDVANRVFTQCIKVKKDTNQVKYNFKYLENHTGQDGAVAENILSITPPSWLNIDQRPRATEREDGPPVHPLALMVKHRRLELLQHPLISCYISYKWRWLLVPLVVYLLFYLLFLTLLTTFALHTPRPGPEDEYCPSIRSGYSSVNLDLEGGECKEPDQEDLQTFGILAVFIIFFSTMFLVSQIVFPIWSLCMWPAEWCTVVATVIKVILKSVTYVLTIIFVSGFMNDCWCAPPWQWQIGAMAVFLAYVNFILLLRALPWFGIGVNISMLLNIVTTFLKLIYLPILLILAFAFPFYMLFVRESTSVQDVGVLLAFSNPARSIVKTIMQVTGELDFDLLFNDGNLLYSPMAYILFISFVVLMPILFLNLLTGLAVGTTETDVQEATLKEIELQVNYIVALESLKSVFRCGRHQSLTYPGKSWFPSLRGLDYETQKQLAEDLHNDTFHRIGNKVDKESVTTVLGINNSLLDYLDKRHQALQAELKEIREVLEELRQKP